MIKFDSLFEDKILVRKRAEEKITKSGIIIPDQFIENRWRGRHAPEEPKEGIIIATGEGRHAVWDNDYDGKKRIQMTVKNGDRIFYDKNTAKEVNLDDDDKYFLMFESGVCFVITPVGDIQLLEDRIIVKPIIKETYGTSNIIIPEQYQDKVKVSKRSGQAPQEGVVIAVGPGVWTTFDEKKSDRHTRLIPMEVKIGDKVYYNKHSVKSLQLYMDETGKIVKEKDEQNYKKEEYYLLWEASIYGIIEEE